MPGTPSGLGLGQKKNEDRNSQQLGEVSGAKHVTMAGNEVEEGHA